MAANQVTLHQLLKTMVEADGTDLHVTTNTPPQIRVHGKLMKLQVDLGSESRVLVAGISKEYESADLLGRQIVMVANLEPARLMGIESQGMVLAASVDGKPVLLRPDDQVPNGTPVR